MAMNLIDTSCWVHCLRQRGNTQIRSNVEHLMRSGEALWCPQIRLELWKGVGSEQDRLVLKQLEQTLPELDITDDVWELACDLAGKCRAAGRTVPSGDLLIAACARHHGAKLVHADKHFDWIAKL